MSHKVVYTIGILNPGGAELRSLEVLACLKRDHCALEVLIFATSLEPGALEESFRAIGATIVRGPPGWRGLPAFWRTCRDFSPTVVHCNTGIGAGSYLAVAALLGVTRRYCHLRSHGDDWKGLSGLLKRSVATILLLAFATKVIGVAASIRAYACVPRRKWLTLYDATEAARPQGEPRKRGCGGGAERKSLLFLGRVSPEKNYLRAVRVAAALNAAKPGWTLDIVGTGSEEHMAQLDAAIRSAADPQSVVLHGHSDSPLEHLRRADVLLLPSCREGMPGSVLEALSAGVPVVASRLPGLVEISPMVEGLTLVDLDASDEIWAGAILDAQATSPDRIMSAMRSAPFGMAEHLAALERLWALPSEAREKQA